MINKLKALRFSREIILCFCLLWIIYLLFSIHTQFSEKTTYHYFNMFVLASAIGIMAYFICNLFLENIIRKNSMLSAFLSIAGVIFCYCLSKDIKFVAIVTIICFAELLWNYAGKGKSFNAIMIFCYICNLAICESLGNLWLVSFTTGGLLIFISLYRNNAFKYFANKAIYATVTIAGFLYSGYMLLTAFLQKGLGNALTHGFLAGTVIEMLSTTKYVGTCEYFLFNTKAADRFMKGYMPMYIIGEFGIIAGIIAVLLLICFIICFIKKAACSGFSKEKPINIMIATFVCFQTVGGLLFPWSVSFSVFAQVPVLSVDTKSLIMVFLLLGFVSVKPMVEIHSKRSGLSGRLSNSTFRKFKFDGIECSSIEGVLQAFKFHDKEKQLEVCRFYGEEVNNFDEKDAWQEKHMLYWNGKEYARDSKEYQELLNKLYVSAVMCSKTQSTKSVIIVEWCKKHKILLKLIPNIEWNLLYRERPFFIDMKKAEKWDLDCSVGCNDITKTVLTTNEFLKRLDIASYIRST